MSSPSFADRRPIGVAVLGSTGSVGSQTLDVLRRLPERFRVVALAAGRNEATLREQTAEFRPVTTSLGAEPGALVEIARRDDVDLVVVATAGIVSLRAVLAALEAGKVVATANKETLVAGGHLVLPLARRLAASASGGADSDAGRANPMASPLAWLRPIDSEHSALWQCLVGEPAGALARVTLTASGGPFREGPPDLSSVTPEMALRHPTWRMGPKITIDSATLANKGLEVIEAHWLYDVPYDAIDVVIHPQSVVHSLVQLVDGSLKAQLGTPDMRLPIQYALTHPDRLPSPAGAPDLTAAGRLDFGEPDEGRFPALRIARDAGRTGQRAAAALIAADDVAVARFLDGTLDFPGIPRLLEAAVARFGEGPDQEPDLDTLVALDGEVRAVFANGPIARVG